MMSVSGVASLCLMVSVLWLLALSSFFALVVARAAPGPGVAPTGAISYDLERTPAAVSNGVAAELESQSIETRVDLRIALEPEVAEVSKLLDINFHLKDGDESGGSSSTGRLRRRNLVGSSPPTCRSKCGNCAPCRPVHVAIGSPHGVISETEYYPEVWRCQCGNRYYMP